jgi:iron(III) transport system substrate-binding protein
LSIDRKAASIRAIDLNVSTQEAPLASHTRSSLVLSTILVGLAIAACGTSSTTPGSALSPSPAATAGASPTTAGASPTTAREERAVVYSGRSEELVGPILERFEATTGIDLEVRYAGTSQLAATILEEGDNSPADVFFSQDGGALGAIAKADRLLELPKDLADLVDTRFRAADGTWVGISGRARVLAYDTRELQPTELPNSVLDLASPSWKGRVAWVPTNASFQTFVTALRLATGDEATLDWLRRLQYDGNAAALEAVRAGEADVALINHYYLFQARQETGDAYPVANHFFVDGDPGALVNVAGVGILRTAGHPVAAERLVRFLLGEEAQTYFSTKTFEYPLRSGIAADDRLPSLDQVQSPDLDLTDLDDLEGTLRLLQEAGVL